MAQRHSHLSWFIMAPKTNRHLLGVAIAIYFHYGVGIITPWKFNIAPEISHPKRKVIFQPWFFRGELLNFGGVPTFLEFASLVVGKKDKHIPNQMVVSKQGGWNPWDK